MVSSDNAPDPHAVIANRDEIAKALRRAADDVSTLPVSALIDPDNAVSAALLAHTTAAVEHLVVFWDGHSPGSAGVIAMARARGVPCEVVRS